MENIIRNNNKFVVLDIETSHFHPKKGGMIIEIAAIKIIDDKIVDKRNQLINPERKIAQRITDLTGITNEMLEGKAVFREVLPNFYNFLGDSVVVAHNAQFDWDRFLVYFLEKVGIYPKNQVVDTLVLSRRYIKGLKSYSLGNICKELDINLKNAHRALGDSMATAELFIYLKNNYIMQDNNEQVSFTELLDVKEEAKPQEVRKVAYWSKDTKDKNFRRLYITLDRSVVFYDLPTEAWEVKASNEPIDFEDVEKKVLKHLKVKDMREAVKKCSS